MRMFIDAFPKNMLKDIQKQNIYNMMRKKQNLSQTIMMQLKRKIVLVNNEAKI